jgi:hypothetical protein
MQLQPLASSLQPNSKPPRLLLTVQRPHQHRADCSPPRDFQDTHHQPSARGKAFRRVDMAYAIAKKQARGDPLEFHKILSEFFSRKGSRTERGHQIQISALIREASESVAEASRSPWPWCEWAGRMTNDRGWLVS